MMHHALLCVVPFCIFLLVCVVYCPLHHSCLSELHRFDTFWYLWNLIEWASALVPPTPLCGGRRAGLVNKTRGEAKNSNQRSYPKQGHGRKDQQRSRITDDHEQSYPNQNHEKNINNHNQTRIIDNLQQS